MEKKHTAKYLISKSRFHQIFINVHSQNTILISEPIYAQNCVKGIKKGQGRRRLSRILIEIYQKITLPSLKGT